MDAADDEGTLSTRALRFRNPALYLNADAAKGELRVEVLGSDKRPLAGFGAADCEVVRTDSLRHRIGWKGNVSLASLAGKDVRLKFYLRNASLYSFSFGGGD
jgi:hypothetical protein